MKKSLGFVGLLCLFALATPLAAEPSPVPPSLKVKVDAAAVRMMIRLTTSKLQTLAGAELKISNSRSDLVSVRANTAALVGGEPHTFVVDHEPYQLVLRVGPTQLASVIRAPAFLATTPEAIGGDVKARDVGIRVRRCAPIKIVERRGAAAKIKLDNGRLAPLVGWIPIDAIGTSCEVHDLQDHKDFAALTSGNGIWVSSTASLLQGPRGKVFAKLSSLVESEEARAIKVAEKGSSTLVLVSGLYWHALGWIPSSAVRKEGVYDEEEEEEVEAPETRGVMLAKGTPLLAKPGGEIIGWVTIPHVVIPRELTPKGYRLSLPFNFGSLDVWVAPPLPPSSSK